MKFIRNKFLKTNTLLKVKKVILTTDMCYEWGFKLVANKEKQDRAASVDDCTQHEKTETISGAPAWELSCLFSR